MKIIKISFENINNLKGGPHVIAFDEAPLANAGLFAITGPTGSGKSTLLDVITLALFNRVPRFSKAVSKKEMQDLGSIMTHHTSSASASIEYEVRGRSYTSSWEISKARTGNLRDYHMTLMDDLGVYFDLKKSEVPAKNEAIIGLNYDQFVKSIILAQGEFSKFLKADKNERGQLLENITGATIYRSIGQAAFHRYKSCKEAVDLAKAQLEGHQVLTDEERKLIQDNIHTAQHQKQALDKDIKNKRALLQIKTALRDINLNIKKKTAEFNHIEKEIKAFEPQLKKLQLHEKLNPLRGDISLYENDKTNINHLSQQILAHEKELKEANQALTEVISDIGELTRQNIDRTNFRKVISTFEKEVNHLDTDIAAIKAKGDEQRQRINEKIIESPLPLTKKTDPTRALEQLQQYSEKLNQIIRTTELDSTSNVSQLKEKLKTTQQVLISLNELLHSLEHIKESDQKLTLERKKLSDFKAVLEKNNQLHTKCEGLVTVLKEKEDLLRKQKEDAIRIAHLEDLRPDLQAGDPCPLCGSLEHPYSLHQPDDRRSAIDSAILNNKSLLNKETNELKKTTDTITMVSTSITMTQERITTLEKTHADSITQKEKTKDRLPSHIIVEEENLAQHISDLSHKNQALDQGIEALEEVKVNDELIKEYTTLAQVLIDFNILNEKRKQKTTITDIATTCNDLQDRFIRYQAKESGIAKALEIEQTNLKKLEQGIQQIESKLKPKLTALGFKSTQEIIENMLNEEERHGIQTKHQELLKTHTAIDTELNTLHKSHKGKIASDTQPVLDLEIIQRNITNQEQISVEIISGIGEKGNKIKHDDQVKLIIKDKEQELGLLNKKLEKWDSLNKYIGDSTGNKFANFAQGLTLQHLLALANKRLRKLSNRYLLDRPSDDGILKVIDEYQGNTERAVTTLSGGETFLISLALALSLSDMASKNVPLDSLFIDEGFGTLDQETLDVAMDTLERLQSESQKTVGIISHVEALKERINVQIKLHKNAQGYSRVEVVG